MGNDTAEALGLDPRGGGWGQRPPRCLLASRHSLRIYPRSLRSPFSAPPFPVLPTAPQTTDAPRAANRSHWRSGTCEYLLWANFIPGPSTRHRLPRIRPPKRDHDEWLVGGRPGGGEVVPRQAQDPAGRAAQQPSRHYQRRGEDRVTPPDGRGARARGSPRPALSETSGRNPPADLDRGPEAWPGDAASGEPEARWIEAQNPGRTGEAQPHLTADDPLRGSRLAGAACLQGKAAKDCSKTVWRKPGRRFGASTASSCRSGGRPGASGTRNTACPRWSAGRRSRSRPRADPRSATCMSLR